MADPLEIIVKAKVELEEGAEKNIRTSIESALKTPFKISIVPDLKELASVLGGTKGMKSIGAAIGAELAKTISADIDAGVVGGMAQAETKVAKALKKSAKKAAMDTAQVKVAQEIAHPTEQVAKAPRRNLYAEQMAKLEQETGAKLLAVQEELGKRLQVANAKEIASQKRYAAEIAKIDATAAEERRALNDRYYDLDAFDSAERFRQVHGPEPLGTVRAYKNERSKLGISIQADEELSEPYQEIFDGLQNRIWKQLSTTKGIIKLLDIRRWNDEIDSGWAQFPATSSIKTPKDVARAYAALVTAAGFNPTKTGVYDSNFDESYADWKKDILAGASEIEHRNIRSLSEAMAIRDTIDDRSKDAFYSTLNQGSSFNSALQAKRNALSEKEYKFLANTTPEWRSGDDDYHVDIALEYKQSDLKRIQELMQSDNLNFATAKKQLGVEKVWQVSDAAGNYYGKQELLPSLQEVYNGSIVDLVAANDELVQEVYQKYRRSYELKNESIDRRAQAQKSALETPDDWRAWGERYEASKQQQQIMQDYWAQRADMSWEAMMKQSSGGMVDKLKQMMPLTGTALSTEVEGLSEDLVPPSVTALIALDEQVKSIIAQAQQQLSTMFGGNSGLPALLGLPGGEYAADNINAVPSVPRLAAMQPVVLDESQFTIEEAPIKQTEHVKVPVDLDTSDIPQQAAEAVKEAQEKVDKAANGNRRRRGYDRERFNYAFNEDTGVWEQIGFQGTNYRRPFGHRTIDTERGDQAFSSNVYDWGAQEKAYENIQSKLEATIQRAEATIQKLQASGDSGMRDRATNLQEQLDAFRAAYANTNPNNLNAPAGNGTNQIGTLVANFDALKNGITGANAAFQSFEQSMRSGWEKAQQGAEKSLNAISKMRAEWTRMSNGDRSRLSDIENSLNQGLLSGNVQQIARAQNALTNFRMEMQAAGKDSKSFGDKLKSSLLQITPLFSTAKIAMSLRTRFNEMIKNVKEIDAAMTELKKVSNETDASYENFLQNAGTRSQQLAVSMTDYIDAATNFNRLGESFEDSQLLGEQAIKLKNVGAQINSIDDATNTLISSMKAFKIDTTDVEKISDAMTYIGNTQPITAGAIGDMLQRSAASMAAANTSFEQTIALGTAANAVIQNPEKVGTAMSTMSMRLRGSTAQLEEAGEEIDEFCVSTSKLQEQVKALTGVDIMKSATEYKDVYEIMREISEVYDQMTDVNRAALLEAMFGKRNANVGTAILSNFDIAKQVLSDLTDGTAEGYTEATYDKYLDTVVGKMAKMEAAYQSFSTNVLNANVVGAFYDAGSGVLDLFNGIIDVLQIIPQAVGAAADSFPALAAAAVTALSKISGLGSIFTAEKNGSILTPYQRRQQKIDQDYSLAQSWLRNTNPNRNVDLLPDAYKQVAEGAEGAAASNEQLAASFADVYAEAGKNNQAFIGFKGILKGVGATAVQVGAQMAAMLANFAIAYVASVGLQLLITGLDNLIHASDKAIEAAEEVNSKWKDIRNTQQENKKTIEEYGETWEKYRTKVNQQTGANEGLNSAEFQEYIVAVNALADVFPEMVTGWDENNNAILGNKSSVEQLNEELERTNELSRQQFFTGGDAQKSMRGAYELTNKDVGNAYQYLPDLTRILEQDGDVTAQLLSYLNRIEQDTSIAERDKLNLRGYLASTGFYDYLGMDSFGAAEVKKTFADQFNAIAKSVMPNLSSASSQYRDIMSQILLSQFSSSNQYAKGAELQPEVQRLLNSALLTLPVEFYNQFEGDFTKLSSWVADFVQQVSASGLSESLQGLSQGYEDYIKGGSVGALEAARESFATSAKTLGFSDEIIDLLVNQIAGGNWKKYEDQMRHAQAIVVGSTDEFVKTLSAKELEFADTVATENPFATESDFRAAYEAYIKTQQTSVSALSSAWESLSKKQDEAVKALNAQDQNHGILTKEAYSSLIAANPLYAQSLRVGANGLEIDQQALNAQLAAERQDLLEQNNGALEEAYKKLNTLTDELAKATNETDDQITARKQEIESLKKEIINRELLNNELKYASSPLGQWAQANEQGEAGDAFRDLKSAVDALKEGMKSGRTQTNKYRAAGNLLFGDTEIDGKKWQEWSKRDLQKQYDKVSKYYDKDGQLNYKYFREQARKQGIVDENYKWNRDLTVEQMAGKMGVGSQYFAQMLKAASEYDGVNIDFLNDQIEALIPKSEVDSNTDAIVNNTASVDALTNVLNSFTEGLGDDYHPGNVSTDPKTRNKITVTEKNIDALKTWDDTIQIEDALPMSHFSQALGFGKGDNAFTISFTPITPDGRVLDKARVDKYLWDLFGSTGGDIEKIIEADKKTSGGMGIIEAIFSGADQIENANIYGQLVHSLLEAAWEEEGEAPPVVVDVNSEKAQGKLAELFSEHSALTVTVRYVDENGKPISSWKDERQKKGLEAAIVSEVEDREIAKESPDKALNAQQKAARQQAAADAIADYYGSFNQRLLDQKAEIQRKQKEAEAQRLAQAEAQRRAQKAALDSASASEAEDKQMAKEVAKEATRKAAQRKQDQFWAAQKERYANLDEDQGSYASGALDGLKDAQRDSILRQARSENALTAKVQEIQDKIVEAYLSGAEGFDDRINDYLNDTELQGQLSEAGLDFGQIINDAINAAIAKSKAPTEESAELDTSAAEAQNEALDNEIEEPATKPVEANTTSAQAASEALHTSLSSPVTIPVSLSVSGGGLPFGAAMKYKGFASGTSNAPDGPSLVGEAGPEIIVDKKLGRWHLAKGPEIRNLNKGDIVYNAKQTQEILRGKGGAKAALGGNSYEVGFTLTNARLKDRTTLGGNNGDGPDLPYLYANGNGNGGKNNGKKNPSASDMQKKFSKLFDWIEIALKVAQKRTQKLIKLANQQIGWRKQNAGLDDAIRQNSDELKTNEKAAKRYQLQADRTAKKYGLSAKYIKKIQEGAIDIESLDDKTKAKVTEYQKWYEKAQACLDTIEELKEQEKELSLQKLTNIQDDYEAWIGYYQKLSDVAEATRKRLRATGKEIREEDYYEDVWSFQRGEGIFGLLNGRLVKSQRLIGEAELEELKEERAELQEEFDEQIRQGYIQYNDENYVKYKTELKDLDKRIEEGTADLAVLREEIARLALDKLEKAMKRIQQTRQETENLMNLHESQGTKQIEDYYVELIKNGDEEIENLQAQRAELVEIQKMFDEGSDKWVEYQDAIDDVDNSIWSAMSNQEKWNDAIADLKIQKLQDQKKELEKTNDAYQKQLDYEKALQDLERARNQKNVLVYRENVGFRYEADEKAVREAQEKVDQLYHQQLLDKIDEAIDAIEENKETDNVYNYEGTDRLKTFAAGGVNSQTGIVQLDGSRQRSEVVFNAADAAKLYDLVHNSTNLSEYVASSVMNMLRTNVASGLSGVANNRSIDLSIGDIIVQGVNNSGDLARQIINALPNQVLQEISRIN